jgi:hypothetical protein
MTQTNTAQQPKKTPKVTKLNAPKTPNGDVLTSAKKSTSKPKKKVVAPPKDEEEEEAKPQMTEAERLQQREKAVLYLRHRLQKGFLSRDTQPQESEMAGMADFFSQLESYENLEPSIIRTTKIHKVLKAIVKLTSIPREEQFNFKKRSAAMLEIWNKRMEADGDAAPAGNSKSAVAEEKAASAAPETNGHSAPAADAIKQDEETKEGAKEDAEEKGAVAADNIEEKVIEAADGEKETTEPNDAPVEETKAEVAGNDIKDEAEAGDVSTQDAPEDTKVE